MAKDQPVLELRMFHNPLEVVVRMPILGSAQEGLRTFQSHETSGTQRFAVLKEEKACDVAAFLCMSH